MEVRAHLRFLRIAPRKVRLVIDLVRGMAVDRALDQLSILPKRSSLPVTKLIKSAVANATHNFQVDAKTLVVKSIFVNEGPRLKRYQPRAFGRAGEILKRTSHVTVVLEGKETKKPTPVKEDKPAKLDLTAVKKSPAEPKGKIAAKVKTSDPEAKAKERSGRDKIIHRQGKS